MAFETLTPSTPPETSGSELLVHCISENKCNESDLSKMFLMQTDVQPMVIQDIKYSDINGMGTTGKAIIVFKSNRHANLAFDTFDDKPKVDISRRKQKTVNLGSDSYVHIRKMAYELVDQRGRSSSNGTTNTGKKRGRSRSRSRAPRRLRSN